MYARFMFYEVTAAGHLTALLDKECSDVTVQFTSPTSSTLTGWTSRLAEIDSRNRNRQRFVTHYALRGPPFY